ncbi:RNA polymerase sigma factor [Ectothiorhodospiraceae bacterium WFHF3C12]|nr:RNA polymerase sigma factor [Ectothiorhodospiraceae bacterium WFHF3C12]
MRGSRERQRARRFEALVRPHLDALYRLAYRYTQSVEDAEDAVQELLTRLYPRTEELAGIEQLRPWLARVLRNQLTDSHRRQGRDPMGHLRVVVEDAEADHALERMRSETPTPDEAHGQSILRERLEAALAVLSAEHREVIVLHDVEGYTLTELTVVIGVPVGTLKSRLHRARDHLRRVLGMEPFGTD